MRQKTGKNKNYWNNMPKLKHPDIFTSDLFEQQKNKGGPKGLAFKDGKLTDEKGNVYNPDTMDVVKEAPSEGLKIARQQHPDWSDSELSELAAFYSRQLKKGE
jgi:hypothetical protein